MSTGNPCVATDAFGEEFTAYTDGADVYIESQHMSAHVAFVQPVEDSPIDLDCDPAGTLTITYLDADGLRLTKESHLDGVSGSWS